MLDSKVILLIGTAGVAFVVILSVVVIFTIIRICSQRNTLSHEQVNGMIRSPSYTCTAYESVILPDISKTETGYNGTAISAMHQHGTDVDIAIRDSCDVTENPYAESIDGIYDHTYNRRHHSTINDDLYSHATHDTTNQNGLFYKGPTYENISKIDRQ